MANAAIASDVHETFDVELDFAAKVTFDFVIVANDFTNFGGLVVGPVLDFDVDVNAGFFEDFFCARTADAKDVGQGDFTSFVLGEVNSHDSYCHIFSLVDYWCVGFDTFVISNYPWRCLYLGFFLLMT